jgi:hypothetical protein
MTTQARFTNVIEAIDALVAEESPTAVRFEPNPLSETDVDEFINQCLQRGSATGEMPDVITMTPASTQPVAPAPRVATPRRRTAPARRTARTTEIEPRFNRFASTCTECGEHVPAQAGLLTGRVGRKWLVKHVTCPTATVEQPVAPRRTRPATLRTRPAARSTYVVTVEVEVDADGISSPREAALLAMREVFTGAIPVTVANDDDDDDGGITVTI